MPVVTSGFAEFLEDNVKEMTSKMKWMEGKTFKLATSISEVAEFVDKAIGMKICAVDLETTGLNTRTKNGVPIEKIVGISMSYDVQLGIYIPINHKEGAECNLPEQEVLNEIRRLCMHCITIYQNAKFDLQFLKNYGIVVNSHEKFEDTQILARLYDSGVKEIGLKHLSNLHLNQQMIEFTDICKEAKRFDFVNPKIGYIYAASDAVCTLGLYYFFISQDIIKEQSSVYKIEKRVVPVVMEMESNLVKINVPYLKELKVKAENRIKEITQKIYSLAGREFNIASSQQLGKLLFTPDGLGYTYPDKNKTASGQFSTSDETLKRISDQYPIIKSILEFRGIEKLLGTYIENLLNNHDDEDCIKLGLNQSGTDTGRFSSPGGKGLHEDGYCGVNSQNLPARVKFDLDIRHGFIARPGKKLVAIDYSGEELRVAANLSREPKWIDEFLHGDADLHTKTGQLLYGRDEISKTERNTAKCVAKGTLIASDRGWIPIENLTENDKVITHTGKLKKISKIHNMGVKPGIILKTRTGHTITAGENHRFLTNDDKWIKAKDIKIGQIIKTISCNEMNPKNTQRKHFNIWDKGNNNFVSDDLPYIEISSLWARLMGYILGDGSVCVNWTAVWCSENYPDIKQDIIDTAVKLGLSPRTHTYYYKELRKDGTQRPPLHQIRIGSRVFIRFLREIGFTGRREWKTDKNSPDKHKSVKIFRVPRIIFESPKDISREFLSGLFETDGTVSDTGVSVTTKDRELAEDLVLLLSQFGIRAKVGNHESKKYNRMYYKVFFGRTGSEIFEKKIGFISKSKKEKLSKLTGKIKRNSGFEMVWETEVKEKISIPSIELMDLSVDEDHTYVAQGLITHNTFNFQILYGAGSRGLSQQASIPEREAKRLLDNFFKGLPVLKRWIDVETAKGRKQKCVKTEFGRIRPLAKFYDTGDRGDAAHGDRCTPNTRIQGTCADIMKTAMVRVYNWIHSNNLQDDIKMLMTVHDEIVFEITESKMDLYIPKIADIMRLEDILQGLLKWPVPLDMDVEYGDSWRADHDYFKEHPEAKKNRESIQFHNSTQVLESTKAPETHPDKQETVQVSSPSAEPVSAPAEPVSAPAEPVSAPAEPVSAPEPRPAPAEPVSAPEPRPAPAEPGPEPGPAPAPEPGPAPAEPGPEPGPAPAEPGIVELSPESDNKNLTNDDYFVYIIKDKLPSTQRRLNDILLFLTEEEKNTKYQGSKKVLKIRDKEGNSLLVSEFRMSADAFISIARYLGI